MALLWELCEVAPCNYGRVSDRSIIWSSGMASSIFNLNRRKLLAASGAAVATSALPRFAGAQAAAGKIKIGVIGAGHIGSTIGGLWVKAGHAVLFSSRHPDELTSMVEGMGPLAKAGSVAEALDFGEAILIAVPYKAIPDLAKNY